MNMFLTIALRHWKPILGLNIVIGAIASYSVLTLEPTWTAKAELILPNSTSDLDASLGRLGNLSDEGINFSQYVNPLNILRSIMTSNEAIRRVWEEDPERLEFDRLDVYKNFFEVSPQGESTILSISAEASTPELAEKRVKALIEVFQARLNELRQDDAQQRSRFLETELAQAYRDLQTAQAELATFQTSSGLVNSTAQTTEAVVSLNELRTRQAEISAQMQAKNAEVKILSARLNRSPTEAITSLNLQANKAYQSIQQELAKLEVTLAEARSRFSDTNPQVLYLLEQQDRLQQQLEQYASPSPLDINQTDTTEDSTSLMEALILTESQATGLEQEATQLQNQIEQLNTELKTIPVAQARLTELQQQYDIAEGVYNGLVAQVQETKLNAFSAYPSVQVLDQPLTDPQPSGPGKRPIALGAILASIFGSTALALWLERKNPLLTPKDIRSSAIPVLRSIPRLKNLTGDITLRLEKNIEYQRLASDISMLSLPKQRLLITSATAKEGKTTITLGLGAALTSLGFRVLLVDADFHNLQLSQCLLPDPEATAVPINVRPQLDLLIPTLGEENLNKFITQGRLEDTLDRVQAANDYDYVLIDSSSLSLSTEAFLLALVINNILMVVSPGNSYRNPFQDNIQQLKRDDVAIAGLVVNGVETANENYLYEKQVIEVSE